MHASLGCTYIYKHFFLKENIYEYMMQSYLATTLDRRLQEDWARDAKEGLRILMSLRVDFGPMG